MLLRLWLSGFDPERLGELNDFATSRSGPMFDSFDGCLGYAFAHSEAIYWTLSLWSDREAIARAEQSDLYKETVEAIHATGILQGDQQVEVLDLHALSFEG